MASETVGDLLDDESAKEVEAAVRRALRADGVPEHDIDDYLQEVWADLLGPKHNDVVKKTLPAFAVAIARSKVSNARRKARRRAEKEQEYRQLAGGGPTVHVPNRPLRKRDPQRRHKQRRATPEGTTRLPNHEIAAGEYDPETGTQSFGARPHATMTAADVSALQELVILFASLQGNAADHAAEAYDIVERMRQSLPSVGEHEPGIPRPDARQTAQNALAAGRGLVDFPEPTDYGPRVFEGLLEMVRGAYKGAFGVEPRDVPWRRLAQRLAQLLGHALAGGEDDPNRWVLADLRRDTILAAFGVDVEALRDWPGRATLNRGARGRRNYQSVVLDYVNDLRREHGRQPLSRDEAFGDQRHEDVARLCHAYDLSLWYPTALGPGDKTPESE